MILNSNYVPILKWKQGEKNALSVIPLNIKKTFTPLIEIVPPTYDFAKKRYKKSIDEHLQDIGDTFFKSWNSELPFFIDLKWLPIKMHTCFNVHTLKYILSEARKKSYKVIPVTGSKRDLAYQNEIKKAIVEDNLGVCFRIEEHDFINIAFYSIRPSDVDLVIDFDYILEKDTNKNYLSIIALIHSIPFINDWRTITLCSTSFPEDTSSIPTNTVGNIKRSEWLIWKQLFNNRASLKRLPSFGDYGISNPNYKEIDPRIMTMSANIRYTVENKWIIVKGNSTRKHGWEQTHNLSKKLTTLNEFSGHSFSWGDKYISDCAKKVVTRGNASTWRKVGTNHHITYVINQLSNLL
mgnify:FL=1